MRFSIASVTLLTVVSSSSQVVIAQQHSTPSALDHFLSTGDNHFTASLPIASRSEIQATFDFLQAFYPTTRRIYWRGLQDSVTADAYYPAESPRIHSFFSYVQDQVDSGINRIAVDEAHARGLEIYGLSALYEWGVNADTNSFFGYPGDYQSTLLVNQPQWKPIDRYGHRSQSGPIEFAYADARQAVVNWFSDRIQLDGYDGIALHTYAENMGTRFGDEFGYSEPIVTEFKNRYGVDIRYEDFDKQAWHDLRGEYTTLLLEELHSALPVDQRNIAMAISPDNSNYPQLWQTTVETDKFPAAGNITQDWRAWADDGTVSDFLVWGGSANAPNVWNETLQYKQSTANNGMNVQLMTSSPLRPDVQSYYDNGVIPVAALDSLGEAFIIAQSGTPAQPVSALGDANVYKRMKVLQQIIDGQTTGVAAASVIPLASNDNLIERRLALLALTKIGDPSAIPVIEAGLMDAESGVRTIAMIALGTLNRPETLGAVINALAQHDEYPLWDAARTALIRAVQNNPNNLNALASQLTSSSEGVRAAAARTMFFYARNQDVNALIAAADDPSDRVRYYAVQALGALTSNQLSITALLNKLASDDATTSGHSATALGNILNSGTGVAQSRRAEILSALDAALKDRGDASQRSDREWAYRLIGPALLMAGDDGKAILRNAMNQRTDRVLSEQAWAVLYLPETPGQFANTTEASDAYAHFKRPRWDTVTAVADTLDNLATGPVNQQRPAVGNRYLVDAGNSAYQVVQSAISNGGNALSLTRTAEHYNQGHQIRVTGFDIQTEAAELTRVVAKADWFFPIDSSDADSATFGIGLPGFNGPAVLISADGNYRVWETDGSALGGSWKATDYLSGKGEWGTIEIILNWDLAGGDDLTTLHGTYDVYVTHAPGDLLTEGARTLIAQDILLVSIPERLVQSLLISNYGDGLSDVTTYWDNLSLTIGGVALVPEPSILLPAILGTMLLRRRK